MIENVLNDVLAAEKKAAEIKNTADENALKAAEKAETRAAEIRKNADEEGKTLRQKLISKATSDAENEYKSPCGKSRREDSKWLFLKCPSCAFWL